MRLQLSIALSATLAGTFSIFTHSAAQSTESSSAFEPFMYFIYYEDTGAECTDKAVGARGLVSNNTFTIVGGEGEVCADEIACILDDESEPCKILDRTVTAEGVTVVRPDGEIYECDSSNPEAECLTFAGCEDSSIFPHCQFDILLLSDLQSSPERLANSEPSKSLEKYAYLAYYTDDECTELAALRGFISEVPIKFTKSGEDTACLDAMACFIQPDGPTCRSVGLNDTVTGTIETQGEGGRDVYECDDSNIDAGEPRCSIIEPEPCRSSSSQANCRFRWISATTLMENPQYLIGDFTSNELPPTTSIGNRRKIYWKYFPVTVSVSVLFWTAFAG